MAVRSTILAIASGIVLCGFCLSQQATVEKVPIGHTSPASAQQMYVAYCAACHGKDGKGGGPAASALKVAPPDLTTLAQRNNGVFPRDRVYATINGQAAVSAHGSKEMPVWGRLFESVDNANSWTLLRLKNLTDYVESLQAKR
ncbi:MAG TPA: c-type cytochrome [Terriglobales bacterium]|nr:c-type cytochrome [Terriglobales bacterium]